MTDTNTIRQALAHVPAHDRETWLRMGMAVKSELGDTGFDLWSEWSQQDESYNDRDAFSVWKSIKPSGRVTVGTLFHEAQQHGFTPDSKPRPPTPEEVAERERKALEAEAEREQARAEAATKAAAIWKAATHAPDDHAYLVRKGIKANGAKLHKGTPLIPMCSDGKIHSLQFINTDGDKKFLTGGRVAGCYFSIGTTKGAVALCICEGFATGATIHEATGYPVAVAFNAGNLLAVAKAMREKFPALPLIMCADDDNQTTGNPGMSKAREAARAVGGLLAVPDFGTDRPDGATDLNDLHQAQGLEAVKRAIAGATAPGRAEHQANEERAPAGDSDGNGWHEPQPLTAKMAPELYPVDALPDTIRAAVEEVAGFVKAPLPMVASSALAALSLAIQAHADAKRAEKLHGPVGLFLLTIADSGERKSTCDGFFTKPIRDYEAAQAEAAKPILKDHKAAIEAWEAKRAGVKENIRQLTKSGKPTHDAESTLRDLEHSKPEAPRIPRLLYADATPEALAFGLAKQWPSAGVVSAEAGIVFGSHGMGKDSVMRNLGLLNQLWDGTSLTIDRRSTESFTVRGARLTVALRNSSPDPGRWRVARAFLPAFLWRGLNQPKGNGHSPKPPRTGRTLPPSINALPRFWINPPPLVKMAH